MRVAMVVAALLCSTAGVSRAAEPAPRGWLLHASPEEAGWSSEKLRHARSLAEEQRSGAVMLVHDGRVVVAWGDVEQRWKVYSVRKSLLSLLLGKPVERGIVPLDMELSRLDLPSGVELTPTESRATVEHLLAARSGVYLPAAKEPAGVDERRPQRGSHPPGSHWFYNNWDFNAAGWVFQELTGRDLIEAFDSDLARPLGFEDWDVRHGFLQREPRRSPIPAYEFRLSARDLARVGQLVLQEGRWLGEEVVPARWVERSTRPRSSLQGGAGYGFMWWVDGRGWLAPQLDTPVMDQIHDVAAVGAQGQLLLVVPEWQVVIVHRGDADHGRPVSDAGMLEIAEALLAARTGEAGEHPRLRPLVAEGFPFDAPEVELPTARAFGPEQRAGWVGRYRSPGPEFEVFAWDDGLFIATPGRTDVELFSRDADHLFARALPLTAVVEERRSDGTVESFRLRMPDGRELVVRRQPADAGP
jgi:CubicO group peptidase (beta-lactamase class C family)